MRSELLRRKMASVAARDNELYHAWKSDPNPENLGVLMKQLEPISHSEAMKWKQTLINPDLLKSKANTLTYEALQSYNPSKSQLNTHVINYLKKMNRFVIENQQAVRVPEEKIFEYRSYMKKKEELSQELGRDPNEEEIKRKFGKGVKISKFKPVMEHFYSGTSEAGGMSAMDEISNDIVGVRMAVSTMTPQQQRIFKMTYGYEGAKALPGKQIASQLKISPAAVSKHQKLIDKKLKRHVAATRDVLNSI